MLCRKHSSFLTHFVSSGLCLCNNVIFGMLLRSEVLYLDYVICHTSLDSEIVEDLLFLGNILESNQKRKGCCQLTLMLIRYQKRGKKNFMNL